MNYSELGRINLMLNNDGTEIFRQKRFTEDDVTLTVEIADKKFPISNWSRTGLSFLGDTESFSVGTRLENVNVFVNNHNVYDGTIEIKSETKNENGIHYGASFLFKLFPIEAVESIKRVDEYSHYVEKKHKDFSNLNKEICHLVFEMKHFLQHLQNQTKVFETSIKNLGYDDRNVAEISYLEKMTESVHKLMVGFNKKVADLIDIETIPEGSDYHLLFEENIYPFFQGADYPRRAKEKPLGYAGDYEMMNQIYRNSFEGKDMFGKIMHHYTATEISAQSVLFRRPYFCEHYKRVLKERTGDVHILSLASGPCVEFQKLIEDLPQEDLSRIKLTLLDLDPNSLEHAQSKIYEQCLRFDKTVNVQFVRTSVKVFIEGGEVFDTKYDLIYSGGLFDYLDNQVSTAIVTNLYKHLNDGGRMSIGNFTKDDTTKAFCHLITSWHLIHKTEEEIIAWTKYVKGGKVSVDYDPHHINAFLVLEK